MRYELHYAKKDLQGDIPCVVIPNKQELLLRLLNNHWCIDEDNTVFLCAIETPPNDDGIILVDDDFLNIQVFVNSHTNTPTMKKIFIQEYSSYEEAYKVALDMKEVSKLCYE